MNNLEKIKYIIKKKGFWDTINILSNFRSNSEGIQLKSFYRILKKFSHYNSFYRIKDKLVKYKIIELHTIKDFDYIILTKKGFKIYDILKYIEDYMLGIEKEINNIERVSNIPKDYKEGEEL